MVRHPLDEDLDHGLEQIKDRLQSETALDTRVEVGEVVAGADTISVTVTIDGSGDTDEYVATVRTDADDTEYRSTDPDEILEAVIAALARTDGGPLTLTVEEIQYKTGTHRTKYTVTARVLVPSKAKHHWDGDERQVMQALRRELGEANGYPRADADDAANPFADVDDGVTFTLSEVVARVDDIEATVAELETEREREQAWKELVAEHPTLRGTNADPETVRASLEDAVKSGESVQVASGTASCNEPKKECNLDRLTYYATPNGEIDVSRTHTY